MPAGAKKAGSLGERYTKPVEPHRRRALRAAPGRKLDQSGALNPNGKGAAHQRKDQQLRTQLEAPA